ncbi:hypothetical protein AU184_01450 [Mycolicibacterium novocastrense]|uniref:CdiI immunity protein domain-containing protein n=1 Tax=Mycolicibacterium novocastrense TaxID=59813 RepID=A0AAW5SQM4_MYCNV|nr:contact-dependent growth inhibition system immunity protein [Mycolicibacterium novocastrense]KUH64408.1 hypothetical protein AU072_02550 [Mycolicibacterium novocastrense]KUH65087.1 hypothetical protein AU184_01450 [Mycolicibacterium novocastrense]KUH69376.1 hypothetical protein AU183_11780 [Mycolicibacterium novocastrense]MCV7025756.1 hypothetical protein [Mycolicibacterium novocastrense]GAT07836.1 uncharacterized protein RMCN_0969 [Mycolicibacterium novocastrense]
MSDYKVSESIRQFFGGNFHQDWDLTAGDWQGVVDSYAAGGDAVDLDALAREIDAMREAYAEEELKILMPREALSAYNPRPQTYSEWLGRVSERLRQHAERRR